MRWDFLARRVIQRLVKISGYGGAVLAFEMHVFAVRNLQLRKERVVGVGNLREFAGGDGEQLVGTIDRRDLGSDFSSFPDGVIVDHQAAANRPRNLSSRRGNAAKILRAIIVGDEIYRFSVRRKMRIDNHAIERLSEDFGVAAARGNYCEVLGAIFKHGRIETRGVGDPLAVGRPCRGAVFTGIFSHLGNVRAFVGVIGGDRPDVRVVRGVRIRSGAVAGKCQLLPVRRPGQFLVIVIAGSDLRQIAFGKIKNVQVSAAAVEVTDFVLFELAAIDDPGPLGLGLFWFCFFVLIFIFVAVRIFVAVVVFLEGLQFFLRSVAQQHAPGGCCRATRPARLHLAACRSAAALRRRGD